MNDVALIRPDDRRPAPIVFPAPLVDRACTDATAADPEEIFVLIQETAQTVRTLQRDNASLEANERACRDELESARVIWRRDLEDLRRMVEACLERAAAAEQQTEQARTQARLAVKLCEEYRARENAALERVEHAEARADIAEARFARFQRSISSEFSQLVRQRVRSS